jgi:hypothetical protein
MNEILWFVLHWVADLMSYQYSLKESVQAVVRLGNVVIINHNDAVTKVRRGDSRLYWHDTTGYSDNQCVFSSLLNRSEIYKPFNEMAWFDVVSARNYERWKHAEQGSVEALFGVVMMIVIVLIVGYFFVWPFVNVAINYSDIIAGIY